MKYLSIFGLTLFVIILAVTGLMLNHSGALGLESRQIQSGALLSWYGVSTPEISCFNAGRRQVCRAGNLIYLNGELIKGVEGDLRGAVLLDNFLVSTLKERVVLMTPDGEVIEVLNGAHGVPVGIEKTGVNEKGGLVVKTKKGNFTVDRDFISWRQYKGDEIKWADSGRADKKVKEMLMQLWRGKGLPLERVLLDLHSGRVFGKYGVYVMDVMALIFVAVSIIGVWLWALRRF